MSNNPLIDLLESHRYEDLFLDHLFWGKPESRKPEVIEIEADAEGEESQWIELTRVSQYKGIRVYSYPQLPSVKFQAKIDQKLAQKSLYRIVIFYEGDKQVWRWPSRIMRKSGATTKLTSHEYVAGTRSEKMLRRLEMITLPVGEQLDLLDVLDRVERAFDVETDQETKKASRLMVALFEALRQGGVQEEQISQTLARILFVMFGDDTGMWSEASLFEKWIIEKTKNDGSDFAEKLNKLFVFLDLKPETDNKNTRVIPAGFEEFAGFAYVNGGIFEDPDPLPETVGKDFRDAVLAASKTDWADISPAIFGAMFQSVRDAKTRREMGEHYTSEKNILKTLNPLFLDGLREELLEARGHRQEKSKLKKLRQKIADIRFMDPACGCGNFVIIAYRELRALELAIIERLIELGEIKLRMQGAQHEIILSEVKGASDFNPLTSVSPMVSIDSFYGIEIDQWPASIAVTAMFLMERQCDLLMQEKIGSAPNRLPIRSSSHILTANALRVDWDDVFPAADGISYVAGNPPFIGQYTKTKEQTADMKAVWGKDYDGYLDYVTGWHRQALKLFADRTGEFAYVTTNSITQGQPVPALFGPIYREGWRIKFAHRTFAWDSEAPGQAAVHCVIVGFTRDNAVKQRLWEYAAPHAEPVEVAVKTGVNAYLVDGPDVLVGKRSKPLSPLLPPVRFGSKPVDGGNLIVEPADYEEVMADPIAAKYVRPFRMGKELVRGLDRWCLWLEDAEPSEINKSPVLRQRVEANRVWRSAQTPKGDAFKYKDVPHLMRPNKERPLVDYVGIPRVVSENRRFYTVQHLPQDIISADSVFVAADPDGFLFALVSSSMFITWQNTIGGRLGTSIRFSNTLVWNNFPLPEIDEELRQQIIAAGKKVMEARDLHPERSLAEHYNPLAMTPELLKAHAALDKVVNQAFGATRKLTTEAQRLELLFQNYRKLTAVKH